MERSQQFNLKTKKLGGLTGGRSPSPKRAPDTDIENSPVQIASTQEFTDNIDVVWDWDSPQAKKHPRKCQKRLLLQSPKVPLKRHPSGTSTQDFEKLKGELESLKTELAIPDHEESLLLSPIEEADYKKFNNSIMVQHLQEDEFDELMDDNINEQLFACSQQVEEHLEIGKNSPQQNLDKKVSFKRTSPRIKALMNESFEDLLKSFDEKECLKKLPYETTVDVCKQSLINHSIYTSSGKVEFHRTQSFEMANVEIKETTRKTCTQDEIEKKRLEAVAKLQSKRKLDPTVLISQCSSEEIERKRLQAMAKIEAKRQHELIERKRREALNRLKDRQKNAITVKSSLTSRLK